MSSLSSRRVGPVPLRLAGYSVAPHTSKPTADVLHTSSYPLASSKSPTATAHAHDPHAHTHGHVHVRGDPLLARLLASVRRTDVLRWATPTSAKRAMEIFIGITAADKYKTLSADLGNDPLVRTPSAAVQRHLALRAPRVAFASLAPDEPAPCCAASRGGRCLPV